MSSASTSNQRLDGEAIVLRAFDAVRRAAKRATGSWWTYVLLAAVAIALGMFAVYSQANALSTLVALVGVLLLCAGTVAFLVASTSRPASWRAITAGVAAITLGAAALVWPNATLYVLPLSVGIGLIVWGGYDVFRSLSDAVVGRRSRTVLSGIVLTALGVLALVRPAVSAWVLGILAGLVLVGLGVYAAEAGFRLLDLHRALSHPDERLAIGLPQVGEKAADSRNAA